MHIEPSADQLSAFAAGLSTTGPVVMLNLLRFKDHADPVDHADGLSGREAYLRYAEATAPHLARVGGEILWAGDCGAALIGPADPEWDAAAIVRYPSRAAFLAMISDPDYLATARLRSAGLADSRLVPCGHQALPDPQH